MPSSIVEPAEPRVGERSPRRSSDSPVTLLRRVPWALYERLRAIDENRHTRMFYDGGDLYLMSPSRRHENISAILAAFVTWWAVEKGQRLQPAGATTFRDRAKKIGLEPDECFYTTGLEKLRMDQEADLSKEPAPDLAVEVDVSRYSTRKLPRYASLGVREIWLWKKELRVFALQGDTYERQQSTAVLPGFPVAAASQIISNRGTRDLTALIGEFLFHIRSGAST